MSQWIQTFFGAILGCCFAVTSSATAAAEASTIEVNLKFERYPEEIPEEDETFRPWGYSALESLSKPPDGKWKLPALKSKLPIYAFAPMGDEKRLFILDRKDPKDPFYNVLYYDANGNGDLTDDPVIQTPPPPKVEGEEGEDLGFLTIEEDFAEFPTVDTTVKVGGKMVPYAFRVHASFPGFVRAMLGEELSEKNLKESFRFSCTVQCCYRGEVELGGQKYSLTLHDYNTNGRFDDLVKAEIDKEAEPSDPVYPQGDQVYLTREKEFQGEYFSWFGDLLLIRDNLYRASIHLGEKKLKLEPLREGLAAVKLGMPVERMTLSSEDGKRAIMLFQPGETVKIPPGRYRFISYWALRKDREGDLWAVMAAASSETEFATVGEGGVDVLPLGEPYTSSAAVPRSAYEKFGESGDLEELPLDFRLLGRGKEAVVDLKREKGKKSKIPLSQEKNYRPKEPSYKIAKLTGELVAQGSFTYG